MPVPEPRPRFVDEALARASARAPRVRAQQNAPKYDNPLLRFFARWETWTGAVLGAGAAALVTFFLLRPLEQAPQPVGLALTLHEARQIDVLIDSERDLEGAIIRIAASGSVVLDGFDDEYQIRWRADLERGSNLLSLPVIARSAGKGQLIATVEHKGRTRRVAVDLTVFDTKA